MSKSKPIELSIEQIIERAEQLQRRIAAEIPDTVKLSSVVEGVIDRARAAAKRTGPLLTLFSLSNIRSYLLFVGVLAMTWWVFVNFVQRRGIRVAVTGVESAALQAKTERHGVPNSRVTFVESEGSARSRELVHEGEADMAVVQAGTSPNDRFRVLGSVRHEHVLFLVRQGIGEFPRAGEQPTVLTFGVGQGSEQMAKHFFRAWASPEPNWVYRWGDFVDGEFEIGPEIEAIFIVVDAIDPRMQAGILRAAEAGFRPKDSYIGGFESQHPYLTRTEFGRGYFSRSPAPIPAEPVGGYLIDNHLVAGERVTDRQILTAIEAFQLEQSEGASLFASYLTSERSVVIEDAANFSSIIINFVIIIAALFGAEILIERRYIQELNSLISHVSLLQADCNLYVGDTNEPRPAASRYLDACADLLGIISTIAAYYGEKRTALVFNGMTSMLHSRANELKLNIQLKLLQRGATLDGYARKAEADAPEADSEEESSGEKNRPKFVELRQQLLAGLNSEARSR